MTVDDPSLCHSANAFRLMRLRRGVIAEFGNVGPEEGSDLPVRIIVDSRIECSVATARRLLVWLEDALAPHRAALRSEEAKRLSPEAAAVAIGPRGGAIDKGYCAADAARLVDLVTDLGAHPYYERSFRMIDGTIQADRFLLTLDIDEIGGGQLSRVRDICTEMSMPSHLLDDLVRTLPTARSIHFGFEGHPGDAIYKIYLERGIDPVERNLAAQTGEALLLHEAYKWSRALKFSVTGKYRLFPDLTGAAITRRIADLTSDSGGAAVEFTGAMLDVVRSKADATHIQYLEVEEEGTSRRSFDINFYDARLRIREVATVLRRMASEIGVARGQFQVLYDQIKDYPLGHLAGGIHRDGKAFFSIYYGVPAFRDLLRQWQ